MPKQIHVSGSIGCIVHTRRCDVIATLMCNFLCTSGCVALCDGLSLAVPHISGRTTLMLEFGFGPIGDYHGDQCGCRFSWNLSDHSSYSRRLYGPRRDLSARIGPSAVSTMRPLMLHKIVAFLLIHWYHNATFIQSSSITSYCVIFSLCETVNICWRACVFVYKRCNSIHSCHSNHKLLEL